LYFELSRFWAMRAMCSRICWLAGALAVEADTGLGVMAHSASALPSSTLTTRRRVSSVMKGV
jgi:hypothetical protein